MNYTINLKYINNENKKDLKKRINKRIKMIKKNISKNNYKTLKHDNLKLSLNFRNELLLYTVNIY